MTTTLGSPFIPPDNVTLETNASGQLTVKAGGIGTTGIANDAVTLAKMAPGTAGNLITYDAAGEPAAVATGTATYVLTSNGADAAPTFQPTVSGDGWILLQTRNPSASGGDTSSSLTAYPEYMIRATNMVMSGNVNLQLQINGDTGTNYAVTYLSGIVPTVSTGQTSALMYAPGAGFATHQGFFQLQLSGKSRAAASGVLVFQGGAMFGGGGKTLGGEWIGGNATQLSTLTLFPTSGSFSGKWEIFGRNTNT